MAWRRGQAYTQNFRDRVPKGLPHAAVITTAEVTDRKEAIERFTTNLSKIQSVLADGSYTGKPFAQAVKDKLGATVQIAKRNKLHTFAVIPQRWVA